MKVLCTSSASIKGGFHSNLIDDKILDRIFKHELKHDDIRKYRCSSCQMQLILDNRFVVEKQLGAGGFGRAWLAIDLTPDPQSMEKKKKCVIKQFYPKGEDLYNDGLQKFQSKFKDEALRLSALNSSSPEFAIPFFIKYFSENHVVNPNSGIENIYFYIVQEYIEGQDLKKLPRGYFTEAKITDLLIQILEILKHVHRKNTIHRDIKPENIIKSNADRYYLIDFGAARDKYSSIESPITKIGTQPYAAPEQWNSVEIFPASDLYGLAATCVSLMTNLDANKLQELIANQGWKDYLVEKNIKISDGLIEILLKMLLHDSRERYQSAQEIIVEISKLPTAIDDCGGTTQPGESRINGDS